MGTAALLTRAQMTKPRTPAGLLAWMEVKSKRFGSTPKAKAYARSGVDLPKKFYEEIRPLALYASRRYGDRSDIQITPNLTNDNFDAAISVPGEDPAYIEITYAKDGYDQALRLEVLSAEGSVNALAPITIVRKKGVRRQVLIPNEAVNHAHVLQKHLSLVEARLEGKARVSYGKRHSLLVVVDDYIPFRVNRDVKALEQVVKSKIRSLCLDFSEIIVLGASGRLLLSYSVDALRSNNAVYRTRAKAARAADRRR